MKTIIPGKSVIQIYPSGGMSVSVPGLGPVEVNKPGLKWLLRDEFTTALAAGSVNGTNAEPGPGPGARSTAETQLTAGISIASGLLVIPPANASQDGTNSHFKYPAITRAAGKIIIFNTKASSIAVDGNSYYGVFNTATPNAGSIESCLGWFGDKLFIAKTSVLTELGTYANNSLEKTVINLRSAGAYLFKYSDGKYSLIYTLVLGNTASLVPGIIQRKTTTTLSVDFIRIPAALWLPEPILSDGMGSTFGTSDGLGHAEGIAGGLGAGGGGLVWTQQLGTWANAAGVASCTVLDVGATLGIATAPLNTADVLYSCVLGYSAGSGGVIVRYADAANYSYVINDGTNVKLFEVTTASAYPGTQRGTAVKAPAAGARLIVDVSGAAVRVYYNEALIFTYATAVDTTAVKIGLITNNIGNTFNDAVAYAKGTGGEYSNLDRYSN
jgi:hypothetical protein